ncbi:MAG TPA: DUF222 domain-containing protein [Ornithinimicrobium sp.]|uniref:HNH endonuclease signature motif containing protein n=1 Tax=Ornithinimicrobium sp. TaxID=1977084 RepID=UPI002B47467C|nr:DUF222 domain-containing protein [Ornithinimicrobium sp.]HKJ10851.1 DUF222 domain-containing protein [Ornithinimicrobium sp.]
MFGVLKAEAQVDAAPVADAAPGAPMSGGPPVGAVAGPTLPEALARVRTAMSAAEPVAAEGHRVPNGDLSPALGEINQAHAQLERLTVTVLAEALHRGLHTDTGLSAYDWASARCPWLSRAQVGDLVTVATSMQDAGHEPVGEAVTSGRLPVRRAARLLRCLQQVKAVTPQETYAEYVDTLLPVAADLRHRDADLKRLTDHLLGLALSESEHEARAQSQRDLRGVHESSLADGSLTRFIITAEPEGAAFIRSVLTSPLAAPSPDADGPDPRSATQRRYDALVTMLGRGVAAPDGAPSTAKARILVTMPFDVLTGQLTGLGETLTGEVLSPATVRRLACTAQIIPAVLGSHGEVLDLGRTTRLATPAQHLLLWRRDRHCTYPGCTVPPPWCDAHHLTWYSRGGRTDITNMALLCGRHHTLVHHHDLTATTSPDGVHWQRP